MSNIFYLAMAHALLYGPAINYEDIPDQFDVPLFQAFVALAIEDEIVGRDEPWNQGNFRSEVMDCRGRLPQLEGCPRLAEGSWLPSEKICYANYHFAKSIAYRLEWMAEADQTNAEEWQEAAQEINKRAWIWCDAASCMGAGGVMAKRQAMKGLRDRIGMDHWCNGTIPEPVPMRYLTRGD